MKRIYIVAFLMLLCTTADAQIMAKLKEIGMENIRCVQTPETTTVAFENNVYRGTYTGIGKAVTACLDGIPGGNLQMVVLENRIPRLYIDMPDSLVHAYKKGDIGLAQVYQRMRISVDTDNTMKVLEKSEKPENSSAWKVDVVIYPDLFLENNTFDELYTYAINLNPAVVMALWKGAKATRTGDTSHSDQSDRRNETGTAGDNHHIAGCTVEA